MPWKSIKDAQDAGANTSLDETPLTLYQINAIAAHADAIEESGSKYGWATAVKYFKDTHKIKDGAWVFKENVEKNSINSFDAERVNLNMAREFLAQAGRDDIEPYERNGRIYFAAKSNSGELETEDFPDVRIFEAGTWVGMSGKETTYTLDDLEQIARDFNALEKQNAIEAPVKLGHDDGQPLLKTDGLPAAGWLSNYRVKGKFLLADLKQVPKKIAQLIRAGGYRRVSAEIVRNFKSATGKVCPMMIEGLALLGEKHPAVGNLGDIIAARYSADASNVDSYRFEFALGGNGGDRFSDAEDNGGDVYIEQKGSEQMDEELKTRLDNLCAMLEKLLALEKAEADKSGSGDTDDFKAKLAAVEGERDELKAKLEKYEAGSAGADDFKARLAAAETERDELRAKLAKCEAESDEAEKENFRKAIEKKVPPALVADMLIVRDTKKAAGAEALVSWEKELFSRPDSAWLEQTLGGNPSDPKAGSDYTAKKAEAEKYARDNNLDIRKSEDFVFAMKQVGYRPDAIQRLNPGPDEIDD